MPEFLIALGGMNSEKHDLFDKLELILVKIEYAYSIIELFTEQTVVNNHEEIVLSALSELTMMQEFL